MTHSTRITSSLRAPRFFPGDVVEVITETAFVCPVSALALIVLESEVPGETHVSWRYLCEGSWVDADRACPAEYGPLRADDDVPF